MADELIKLSKVVSHALRHEPDEYGLVLDSMGWVNIGDLIQALGEKNPVKWAELQEIDIYEMAAAVEKQRFEFNNNRIRAIYGHSFRQQIKHNPVEPPNILYHGTTPEAWAEIQRQGLKAMKRQYVHLSPDIETARIVAKRHTRKPVIIVIDAAKAHAVGTSFYRGNEKVWLADSIGPEYFLKVESR